jgi:hypothetical protein
MASRDSSLRLDDLAVFDPNLRMKISALGMKVRRRMIVEVQQDQNSVDYGDRRHER